MGDLREVDGIGNKTCLLLNKLGIESMEDLVCYFPKRYNFIKRSDMSLVQDGERVVIDGIVEGQPMMSQVSLKLKKFSFRLSTRWNIYQIVVFNQEYLCRILKYGQEVIIIGKYQSFRNTIVASEIRFGKLGDGLTIEPVYALTEGLSKNTIEKLIQNALKKEVLLPDYIPDYLQERYHFRDKKWCICQVHNPMDSLSYKRAVQRLKYEEFFWYLLKIRYLKLKNFKEELAITREIDRKKIEEFIGRLSFQLTSDQLETVWTIFDDLVFPRRMNRLVQGDVGSGKTIVAFLATYMNYLSGYQTALMVPTDILANQHYQNALSLFKGVDMKIGLLTSSISIKEKKAILKGLENGEVHFVIGTQSLIQESVLYQDLGLIITDEQHRFGVNQRNELKNKGVYPDILSMSATPIPRTYALTIYGDMDVSSIKTKPPTRKEVITYYKNEKDMLEVLKMMKKEIDLGHQIYVIAPSIESDEAALDNVVELKRKMNVAFGKMATVEAVHGKLSAEIKGNIMKEFEEGKIDILISTTVIEVGVNVPNASMIVIFKANLFGLSTLHQLRGRVGRGDIQSYCILLSVEYVERLKVLEDTNDGFEISEYDFKSRGEGDLFGTRQSGDIGLRLADIKRDFELMVRVKQDVDEFVDKYSFQTEYSYLLKQL